MNQDDNLIYFLTDKMTKGKIYPPQELAMNLSREDIGAAWRKLVDDLNTGKYVGHELGLYLHFPFCPSKCKFCYCFSDQTADFEKIDQYIDSMIKEIDFLADNLKGLDVKTIYVGGGTPSYLHTKQIKKVFDHLFSKFDLAKNNYQFNFEGSPYTLNQDKLDLLKALGVNRLSMGVQSLNFQVLKNIKRPQTYEMVINIVSYARHIGIKHINLDYVAGLPGETLATFLKGFTQFIKLKPDIFHLYKFYPADNTIFHKQGLDYDIKNVDLRLKMIKLGEKIIAKEKYLPIRNEFEAWGLDPEARNKQDAERKEKPYSVLGLGNYAKSHIFSVLHYHNGPNHYFSDKGYEYKGCYVDDHEEMRNFIISAGRGGFSLSEFKSIFNKNPFDVFAEQFKYLEDNNLLVVDGDFIEIKTIDSNQFHFLMKKLFYPAETINKLKDFYQDKFNSQVDYQKVLTGKINDNF